MQAYSILSIIIMIMFVVIVVGAFAAVIYGIIQALKRDSEELRRPRGKRIRPFAFETEQRRAGARGERAAAMLVSEILRPEDHLLRNVQLVVDEHPVECDLVVVNPKGVFIIEVKNLQGTLVGEEEDEEWVQQNLTAGGRFYVKTFRNPIKQMKRQVHWLATYLRKHAVNIWVEGYVFFVQMNSPIHSADILETQQDIDNAIHSGTGVSGQLGVPVGTILKLLGMEEED
ncbi:MAG: NERD domain-containing protein [Lachnospiraceae bacterium]|nr:NERD domain-containing protein [Lachnospiraceae bacterium]